MSLAWEPLVSPQKRQGEEADVSRPRNSRRYRPGCASRSSDGCRARRPWLWNVWVEMFCSSVFLLRDSFLSFLACILKTLLQLNSPNPQASTLNLEDQAFIKCGQVISPTRGTPSVPQVQSNPLTYPPVAGNSPKDGRGIPAPPGLSSNRCIRQRKSVLASTVEGSGSKKVGSRFANSFGKEPIFSPGFARKELRVYHPATLDSDSDGKDGLCGLLSS